MGILIRFENQLIKLQQPSQRLEIDIGFLAVYSVHQSALKACFGFSLEIFTFEGKMPQDLVSSDED